MADATVEGVGTLPLGTYDDPERDMAVRVLRDALADADRSLDAVDGLYMPKPRPWTDQGFFTTALAGALDLDLRRTSETYTGGTSGGKALHAAVRDVRAGLVDTAVVLAVERASVSDTDRYFEYILSIFDREFEAPAGPSIPGVYAQSLQRYRHEHDVAREDLAAVVVKNRANGAANPESVFEGGTDVAAVLDSDPVADPLRLLECPRPCDGAAGLVVTGESADAGGGGVRIAGVGDHHAPSHLTGTPDRSLTAFPAAAASAEEALADAGVGVDAVDVFEPYAPFPHVEAVLTEEWGLFDRGDGAAACARGETAPDGTHPVSPSGGCLGRGHPALVTPLLNHVAAVRQIRGTAPTQVPGAGRVLTTSEHGHVDGVTTTVFGEGA